MSKSSTITTTTSTNALKITTESGVIDISLNELPEAIITQLVLHGLKQKICDAAAIPRDTDTGRSATPQQKYDAMRAVADRLLAGEWGIARGAGDGTSGQSLLFRALSRLYAHLSADEIRVKIAAWDKKQQAAVRKNPRVATIIAELQSGSVDVDTDELLGELEN